MQTRVNITVEILVHFFLAVAVLAIGVGGSTFVPAHAADTEKPTILLFGQDLRWIKTLKPREVTFTVSTIDKVTGGCWTTPDSSKTAVELELIRSELAPATDNSDATIQVYLEALGYASDGDKNFCVASLDLQIWVVDYDEVYSDFGTVISVKRSELVGAGGVMSGPKADFSSRIKNNFVDLIQKFLVERKKRARQLAETILEQGSKQNANDLGNYWHETLQAP